MNTQEQESKRHAVRCAIRLLTGRVESRLLDTEDLTDMGFTGWYRPSHEEIMSKAEEILLDLLVPINAP